MTTFTQQQIEQLLKPIAPQRVLKDGKGHSHVSQQDVTAHLIRVFGFGSFDTDLATLDLVFERERMKDGKPTDRYDVCYRAVIRLTVRGADGREVCHFEDGSTGTAQNQTLGDAHDLAMKSAISLAKKRAAINLGDQFGLSLYNKGQMSALVVDTLARDRADAAPADLQADVEPQVSLGNDETDYSTGAPATVVDDADEALSCSEAIGSADTLNALGSVASRIATSTTLGAAAKAKLRAQYTARLSELQAAVKE